MCLAYLRHFAPKSQAVVQHSRFRRILGSNASKELFALLQAPTREFRAALIRGGLRHLSRLRSNRGKGRLYLNVGHTGLDADGFSAWVREADVRPVYLVHDLIPITHPEFCRIGEKQRHRKRMRAAVGTAAGIICNSQATLEELAAFAKSERLHSPPTLAASLGTDPPNSPIQIEAPERPTFVIIGTIEGRKNHLLLLNIWSRLIDQLGDQAPRLLIIGQRGWEAEQVFDQLDRSDALRSHVVELNDCSEEELARHLASACALLFPSKVEGFGLPLVEALSLGVPVIASDLPVFREIAGDIPEYLSPIDGPGWEAAIRAFAQPRSAARSAQLARIKRFRPPDWPSHFQAVEGWLPSLSSAPAARGSIRLAC